MKRLFTAYYYLVYLIKSKNEHGVHSPFVYDLLMEVVYNKSDYYAYSKIENLRKQLIDSKQVLFCNDLGAGSTSSKRLKRTVSQLVNYSAKQTKYAQLLFRLVNYFQPTTVVEIGTSLGMSSAYMAMANSKTNVYTLEGCEEIAKVASANFNSLDLKNIEQIQGNFDDTLSPLLSKIAQLDFVFFDGNHRKKATLNYFQQCLEKANEASVFIVDDIYWSQEMKEAWDEIKIHPQVKVTIDLFYFGIVFFRKEQVKEHFIIKF